MKVPQRQSMINRTAESLREAIRSGELGTHLPGVRKLSSELRVSIPTVLGAVNVLKAEGLVHPEPGRRTRILWEGGGPRPRAHATHQVALLTFASHWISSSAYYQGVLEELRARGLRVRLYENVRCRANDGDEELERIVSQEEADCWVLLGPTPEAQHFFARRRLPCLIDGITLPDLPLPDFEIDYSALYRHAVHQLQAVGHRRICLLTVDWSARNNPESLETFRATVAQRHPQPWEAVRTYDGTNAHFERLLRQLFLNRATAPTGLVIAINKRVIHTMTWLMRHGWRVPEEVSLISREYEEILDCLCPVPASYRQPATAVGRFVRAILAVADRRHIRSHKRVMTEFHPGGTILPPPPGG